MAIGTVTVTKTGVLGNMKYAVLNVVGAASYTTTGDALNLNVICGMNDVLFADVDLLSPSPGVNCPLGSYDYTAKKLQFFSTAAGATGFTEVANAVNLSAQTYRVFVIGT